MGWLQALGVVFIAQALAAIGSGCGPCVETLIAAAASGWTWAALAAVGFSRTRNCITWAVPRWLKNGGHLVIRRSEFRNYPFRHPAARWLAKWVPHVMWITPDGILLHYTVTPAQHDAYWDKGLWAVIKSAVHFEGVVLVGTAYVVE